jgi:hypothetical protein
MSAAPSVRTASDRPSTRVSLGTAIEGIGSAEPAMDAGSSRNAAVMATNSAGFSRNRNVVQCFQESTCGEAQTMKREVREFRAYLAECTDGQVKNAYERELASNTTPISRPSGRRGCRTRCSPSRTTPSS